MKTGVRRRRANRGKLDIRGCRGLAVSSWSTALLLLAAGAAMAQQKPDSQEQAAGDGRLLVAQADMRTFNLPSLPLAEALTLFGQQAGLQVTFSAAMDRGLQSRAVSGTMTPENALRSLLSGTGVVYRFTDSRTVALSRPGVGLPGDNLLDPVRVSDQRETGKGPVRGYVASRSTAGTKTDTPIIETPQAISVVTRDQMDARGVQTVTEALRYTPGVFTQPFGTDRRYDQVYIRGFLASSTGDYRDGLRQPTITFAGFGTEPYGLERIEILKGPSSVLYGQTQPGGIVNRVSKRPTTEWFNEVQAGVGTFGRSQAAFDFGGPIDKEGQFLVRMTGLARQGDHPLFPRLPDDRIYLAPAFTWRPSSDTTLTLLATFQKDNTFTFNNFTQTLTGVPANIASILQSTYLGEPKWDRFQRDQVTFGYEFEHRFNDVFTFRQNARYGHIDIDFRQTEGSITTSLARGLLQRNARNWREELTLWVVDSQVQAKFATGGLTHTLLAGFDLQDIQWQQVNRLGPAPAISIITPVFGQSFSQGRIVASAKQSIRQYGLYAQDQIKLGEQWVLTLGGRFDWADSDTTNRLTRSRTPKSDSAFTWRAGLTYLSDIGLAPYVSYSESFNPTAGTTAAGAPFEPTRGRQYEVGVKYQPKGFKSFFTASLFHLTQRNALTPDPANVSFNVQTGEIRSRGIELEGVASLGLGLNLIASYTYADVEVMKSNGADRGKRPLFSPQHLASAWLDYTQPEGPLAGFGLGAGVRYVGKTYANTTNTLKNEATTLLDATVHYDLGTAFPGLKNARLAVNFSNLLDKKYIICSTGSCYRTEGRTILGTLTVRW